MIADFGESMEMMKISNLGDIPLRDLSGGQQQRVYLAQVLARRAGLLLLDEPTAGLDAPGRAAYMEAMVFERERGTAIVTATHDVVHQQQCVPQQAKRDRRLMPQPHRE